MKVMFIAGFGPIASEVEKSRELYEDAMGIEFKVEDVDYRHTEELKGANSFAIWPLYQAAQSCFGSTEWPPDIPRPQAWLEFDVNDVAEATREMESHGYKLLVSNRTEPWGQVVSRLISPEGLLVGLTMTPWMREKS
ncbi:MAG TPA: VOC family protein [Candidatus Dormibacteraeota bacterium]|nr:VOC family protein [Candidatus Dormibacteraeota bacterium]